MIIKSYKAVASKLELQNAHCDMFHALVLFQTCWGLCQRPVSLKRVCRTSSDCRTRGLEFVPAHSPLGRGKLESLNWLSIELVQQDYAQVISTKHQVSALLTLRQADRRCLQKNQRTLVPLHENHLTLSQRSLGRNQPLTGPLIWLVMAGRFASFPNQPISRQTLAKRPDCESPSLDGGLKAYRWKSTGVFTASWGTSTAILWLMGSALCQVVLAILRDWLAKLATPGKDVQHSLCINPHWLTVSSSVACEACSPLWFIWIYSVAAMDFVRCWWSEICVPKNFFSRGIQGLALSHSPGPGFSQGLQVTINIPKNMQFYSSCLYYYIYCK